MTILFSDLSGYTAMSEKLDPEDVKEITSRIFAQISNIIAKYEGFVEKFVGDAVMAIFGVPKAYEDDPMRAIRAAMEIHNLIKGISPQLEDKIGQALTPDYKSFAEGKFTALLVTCAGPVKNNADIIQALFYRLNDYGKLKVVGKYIVPTCTTPDAMGHEAKEILDEMRRDMLAA